jgi:hypothetical protein
MKLKILLSFYQCHFPQKMLIRNSSIPLLLFCLLKHFIRTTIPLQENLSPRVQTL